jgi:hypothetical protein
MSSLPDRSHASAVPNTSCNSLSAPSQRRLSRCDDPSVQRLGIRALLLVGILTVSGPGFVQTASSLATSSSGPHITSSPCSDLASLVGILTARQITLPWNGHPRFLVKVYCERGPNWYVSETIGQTRPLIYEQPRTFPHFFPVGVVSIFSYSPKAVPIALIETSLGASYTGYELFADVNDALRVIALTSTDPSGILAGGNASFHGEGISCAAEPQGEMTVTQTSWEADTAPPTKNSAVTVSTERWVLGGAALHEVSSTVLPHRRTTYATAQSSLGNVRC